MTKSITIDELLKITQLLLKMAEKKQRSNKLEFYDNNYIKIWHKDRNAFLVDLKSNTWSIGDVNDDIARLKELLGEDKDSMFEYDLERLGAVLIQFGATLKHEE